MWPGHREQQALKEEKGEKGEGQGRLLVQGKFPLAHNPWAEGMAPKGA